VWMIMATPNEYLTVNFLISDQFSNFCITYVWYKQQGPLSNKVLYGASQQEYSGTTYLYTKLHIYKIRYKLYDNVPSTKKYFLAE